MSVLSPIRTASAGVLALGACAVLALPALAQGTYPPTGETGTISSTVAGPNDDMTATGGGFASGEAVAGTLFSTPVPLGTKAASAAGTVSFTWNNSVLPAGAHHLEMVGASGRVVSVAFTVRGAAGGGAAGSGGASTDGGGLAFTGADVAGIAGLGGVLVLAGGTAVVSARRRREDTRAG